MSKQRKCVNVDIPFELHKEIKFLCVAYNKTFKQIFVEALQMYAKNPNIEKESKQLKHMVYRLKYDKES